MRIFKAYLAVTFLAGLMLALPAPQEARAAGETRLVPAKMEGARERIHDLEASIAEDRDNIIAQGRAIKDDRRRIKDAERLSDKTEALRKIDEAGQDIKKREAAIKDLKKSISMKKDERGILMYGKEQIIQRRTAKN